MPKRRKEFYDHELAQARKALRDTMTREEAEERCPHVIHAIRFLCEVLGPNAAGLPTKSAIAAARTAYRDSGRLAVALANSPQHTAALRYLTSTGGQPVPGGAQRGPELVFVGRVG